jgi:Tfp pilus assembly protein PilF
LRGETHPRRALAAFGAFAFATLVLGSAGARSRLDYGPAAPRPADAVRLNSDGLARLARGELAPARQLFERAARTDPTWFVPEINLGLVHRQAGNGDLARAHFDAAVLLDRGAAEARTYRGEFLIGERRWAEALADFEAAIAAGRDTYRNAKGAATAAAALADAGRALRHGNRCQDLEPGRFAVDIVPIANPFFDDEAHARAGVAFFLGLRERLPNAWWVHLNLAALAEKVGDSALASEAAARGAALKGGGR